MNEIETYSESHLHCMKNVRIRRFSSQYFPVFVLSTEIYRVNLPIQSQCEKIWTRKTTNTDILYAVLTVKIYWWWRQSWLYTANESQANHLIKVIVSMMLAFNQGEWLLRLFQFHTAYGSLI